MSIDASRMIENFTELVAIDSPSFEEKQMGEYLKGWLEDLGFSVYQDDAGSRLGGNCGNVYGFLDGEKSLPPLLFCAHMDTVEPARGKRAVIGKDGTIKSRGDTVLGADDCAGIAAIIEALRAIREQKLAHRPIEVLFTVAEEAYCKGVAQFDLSKIRSEEAYVLDLAGPVGSAAYQAPSILSFTVTVRGKASHAGFAPQEGVHAIAAAAQALCGLALGRVDADTTVNVGIIKGGLATNIVPDRCVLEGEIRSYVHYKAETQADLAEKQFREAAEAMGAAVDFDLTTHFYAYETPKDHPVIRRFEKACAAQGLSAALEATFGGSDNNALVRHGIAGIVIANAMNRCHSLDEYTTVDELTRIARLTLDLMTSDF
ncbi:MAG: M20/M25/M40 family metallo-hydrolase [Christensenellales bacterium]